MKVAEYAKSLVKANGLSKAMQIADRCAKASGLNDEASLPRGVVFYPVDRKGGTEKAVKARKNTHEFWKHVAGLLNKEAKKNLKGFVS